MHIILDLVSALELEATGAGTIVFRHLDAGGVMPNSVYYTRTDRVAELGDRVDRFVDGVDAGMALIRAGRAEAAIDQVLAARWPEKDPALLRSAIDQMVAGGVWDTTVIDRAAPTAGCGSSKRADWSALPTSLETLLGSHTVGIAA